MQLGSLIVSICAALIAATSATIAWLGTHPRPELAGNMTTAILLGTQGDYEGTGVLIHCMITNEVSQPVYAMAYGLEVRLKSGWLRLHRPVTFTMPTLFVGEHTWEVDMKPENFIDWTPQKIEFGSPLMGFLVFFHTERLVEEDILEYRLTVTDVFSRSHRFVLSNEKARAYRNSPMVDEPGIRTHDLFRLAGATVRLADKDQSESHAETNITDIKK